MSYKITKAGLNNSRYIVVQILVIAYNIFVFYTKMSRYRHQPVPVEQFQLTDLNMAIGKILLHKKNIHL